MRIAVVSDIHGNRTAFEAVLADLREAAPDLILHGGDLADAGSSPVEIIDSIRDAGWLGVVGNTDEMLFAPETLEEFARPRPELDTIWAAARRMASATREALGQERLAWLGALSLQFRHQEVTLAHASPSNRWMAPGVEANDADLESVYGDMANSVTVYGHIHTPFVRKVGAGFLANSGSVGLPYDGDARAAYLLVDQGRPAVRRVHYDVDREVRALQQNRRPHADWVARMLRAARPEMP